MDSAFEAALIEALDALESGGDIETIVARYPQYATELRPMLLTAESMAKVRIAHSLEAQAASKQRMLDYAAASSPPAGERFSMLLLLRRLSLVVASLAIVLSLIGTGILFASAESVPGDPLYDAKRFLEDTRLSLTGDPASREALQQRYEEERIREVETLIRMGRSEEVAFSGAIEAIDADVWQVAGLEVLVVDTTVIQGVGTPAVGQLVQVLGLTVDGGVRASLIAIRTVSNLPQPAPEPDELTTETPEPSPTRTPTPTATPTPTSSPTPTTDPDLLPPATFTSTPTPMPTATPTLESNENGNVNGNENQGGNSNDDDSNANENQEGNENEDDDDEDNENERGNGNDGRGNSNGGNDNDDRGNDNGNDNDKDD